MDTFARLGAKPFTTAPVSPRTPRTPLLPLPLSVPTPPYEPSTSSAPLPPLPPSPPPPPSKLACSAAAKMSTASCVWPANLSTWDGRKGTGTAASFAAAHAGYSLSIWSRREVPISGRVLTIAPCARCDVASAIGSVPSRRSCGALAWLLGLAYGSVPGKGSASLRWRLKWLSRSSSMPCSTAMRSTRVPVAYGRNAPRASSTCVSSNVHASDPAPDTAPGAFSVPTWRAHAGIAVAAASVKQSLLAQSPPSSSPPLSPSSSPPPSPSSSPPPSPSSSPPPPLPAAAAAAAASAASAAASAARCASARATLVPCGLVSCSSAMRLQPNRRAAASNVSTCSASLPTTRWK
eukprot:1566976-Pleurochrysis_carterae.AAC.2